MLSFYYIFKSLLDRTLSFFLIILLSPLFFSVFILIIFESGKPALYLGKRIGFKGKSFKILKFRTMIIGAEFHSGGNVTSSNDLRITRFGNVLRKYKLDELPQLINVLKGDMSFVGPRPEVKEFVDMYSQKDKEIILSVKPGITDLSSIEFVQLGEELGSSDDVEIFNIKLEKILERKIELRKEYVAKRSFLFDFEIIIKTFIKILQSALWKKSD